MLTHINGIITVHPEWELTLNSYGIEASWRLGAWDSLEKYITKPFEMTFEANIGEILQAAHTRGRDESLNALKKARERLITPLSAASMESYARSYDYIIKLHMLYEIESIFSLKFEPRLMNVDSLNSSKRLSMPAVISIQHLLNIWDSRLRITTPSLKVRGPILNLRRILLHDFRYLKIYRIFFIKNTPLNLLALWIHRLIIQSNAGRCGSKQRKF